ncbi:MAG: 30S ribosomal protein S19 [Candidatus Micrarchaeota archaeon]|nr:30S ribosomal protein S19 [Candidatus Micrarchaeota archaeon]
MFELKQDHWRGMEESELAKLSLEEFMKLIKARPRRAIQRMLEGKNLKYRKLVMKVRKLKEKNSPKLKQGIKTHVRSAVIIPEWLGLTFLVYNGKEWKKVEITKDKLGHRLGEYAFTVKFEKHAGPGIGATRGSRFVAMK